MNGTWIRLTRSELHQKVWAAPIKTVAHELGVSASSLANACRRGVNQNGSFYSERSATTGSTRLAS